MLQSLLSRKGKGQMFLILGILIVIFLVTIRLAVQPSKDITRTQEVNTDNVKKELSKVQSFSNLDQNSTETNLNNFSAFIRNKLSNRSVEFSEIYVSVYVPNVENGTQSNFTVAVGNFLGGAISNVNVTAGNSTVTHGYVNFSSISDGTSNNSNITFTFNESKQFVNLTYTLAGSNITEKFDFNTSARIVNTATFFKVRIGVLDKASTERFVQTDYR